MMKMLTMFGAAALMGAGAMAPVAATAQHRTVVHERTVVKHTGNRYGTRRVCKNEWRHHRKVRVCRTVRYRRW